MADQLEQIREHAPAFLDDGEVLMAAMSASPRGGRPSKLECRAGRAQAFAAV
jgi:hypothetical protein